MYVCELSINMYIQSKNWGEKKATLKVNENCIKMGPNPNTNGKDENENNIKKSIIENKDGTQEPTSPSQHGLGKYHINAIRLEHRCCFGFDIGGSLTKICFFEPHTSTSSNKSPVWAESDKNKATFLKSKVKYGLTGVRDPSLSFEWRNGTFHFVNFDTLRMKEAVTLFQSENLIQKDEPFYATGGGAYKYASMLKEHLGVVVKKGDELQLKLLDIESMTFYYIFK
ncbi:hypothetical protein RFI_16164 [Reticulomyxa filosa]|uniref:Pantothenate kinase n=1 Tax=Reticulomyxa filosa TaxID=46433 RepID=X6N6V8_RETFI|nr:hypothetical protein RFI_16164 [Reticulomyxa filosa]|eukprot:ETO21037.1 hypothetical protein RFI_16164 [Reticulomyxa filosa]